ncbi:PQQ-dependent sugar dehydrogenase [Micromonospora polyrhachis]|uniref:Glucose/arabinose dehydrogenase n=1 Tax=Micromonospora polyrhachis TaxID=1282883 RepID=A0A7W7WN66_9ACTN|nr:PQQ-dependent sugar dehydrogenase [Micromonospora polyrhachis]MBB4957871.1 glucose/arabinose dehydrogenase [Micromonospora polyrhachis]
MGVDMLRRQLSRRLCAAATAALLAPTALTTAALAAPASSDTDTGAGAAAPDWRPRLPLDQLTIDTTLVATGLDRPTAIAAPDDRSRQLFVAEKPGRVRVYHPDTGLAAEPLLDLTDRVSTVGNERGLLGIATAPRFARTNAVYVAYTSLPDGALTLSRFVLDGTDPAADEQVLLTQPHAEFSNHNGGDLAFGRDGHLYWSLGDGGGGNDPLNTGQDLGTLLGKILRLDVRRSCGEQAYCVPRDNPFVGQPGARPEIWAYGLRNAWKFSIDPRNGSLWIADVGQNAYEEVNHLRAGVGGANFGWSCKEGPAVVLPERCQPDARYIDPVFHYGTRVDGCAVIGGHVYRGRQFARIATGTYLATDYCSATAFAIRPVRGGGYESRAIGQLPARPSTFGVDARGELYVASDIPGELHRVSFGRQPS